MSDMTLKPSQIYSGLAETFLVLQVGLMATIPAYLVVAVGLFVCTLREEQDGWVRGGGTKQTQTIQIKDGKISTSSQKFLPAETKPLAALQDLSPARDSWKTYQRHFALTLTLSRRERGPAKAASGRPSSPNRSR